MKRFVTTAVALTFVAALGITAAMAERPASPASYKKVSALTPLPDFIPGLGTLWVDPATLPAGPFLAYDKGGNLVSSVYNAGHPGVAEPHYHVVIWYVTPQQAAALKQ